MDTEKIIREWFYRLPKGYAEAPYSKNELEVLDTVLAEHNISFKEVDQLDQAFNDAEPVEDERHVNLREALIRIGDKAYQLNKAEIDKITNYLEKDMQKTDFSPMARKMTKTKKSRQIAKFAEESHWQEWLSTVEGIVSEKKLQKLYFTLYDVTSATYTAKYIDEVLDELYNISPAALEQHLFSMKKVPSGGGEFGWPVPTEFQGLADIGTVRGGSKGTEMGRGEFIVPFLFERGELGGANATHDVNIDGMGWHVKEIKTRNKYIRLGMTTYANSKLAQILKSKVGLGTKELSLTRLDAVMSENPSLDKMSVIEALNDEYGNVTTESDALITIQNELDLEMRRDGVAFGGGQGVIFYVADDQEMFFVPTDECICGGATQGAHTVGMAHSGRPVGKYAAAAEELG